MHYSRSLRRLDNDSAHRSLPLLLIALAILAAWSIWFTTARIAVYATTSRGRIEVAQEPYAVEAPVAGRVTRLPPPVGTAVRAGDIVLELDATSASLERIEFEARLTAAGERQRSLRVELSAEEAALTEEDGGARGASYESAAKVREAAAALDIAREEAARHQALHDHGLVSDLELLRAKKAAEERLNQLQAAEHGGERIGRDLGARHASRLARTARLRNDLAVASSDHDQARAAVERLQFEVDRRLVRAPIDGTIGEMASLKPGNVIESGAQVCTIVPGGTLRAVAFFTPAAALGRVRNGQDARLKLEGFPWTTYGSLAATVQQVGSEVRDGMVRVDLALGTAIPAGITLQHGLPVEVDIDVERTTPLALLLHRAGDRLRLNAAAPR